jgi:hypothetical protein
MKRSNPRQNYYDVYFVNKHRELHATQASIPVPVDSWQSKVWKRQTNLLEHLEMPLDMFSHPMGIRYLGPIGAYSNDPLERHCYTFLYPINIDSRNRFLLFSSCFATIISVVLHLSTECVDRVCIAVLGMQALF